jgi:methylthioxylose transferase
MSSASATSPGLDPSPKNRRKVFIGGSSALVIAVALVSWATIWGRRVQKNPDVKLGAAPLVGQWKFRPSIGFLMPIGLALLIIVAIPRLFVRLQTRWVVLSSVGLTAAFTAALAGADGRVAMLAPVVHRSEYWFWANKMPPTRQMLAKYDQYDFIVNFGTHIKGHPPGYMLMFKALAALGLAKPWIIASLSYISAGVVAGSVLVVARRFGTAKLTRKAAPVLMLAPYAVWMGTSADAVFSALVALGAAGIAMATTSAQDGRRRVFAILAGLSIGAALYSSWGTVTCGPILLGVLWCGAGRNAGRDSWQGGTPGRKRGSGKWLEQDPGHSSKPQLAQELAQELAHNELRASHRRFSFGSMLTTLTVTVRDRMKQAFGVAIWAITGMGAIAATMTALGYNWFAGMGLTKRLYWKGTAQFRPWKYFLIGNLGVTFIAIGVVAVLGIGVAMSGSASTQRDNRWLRLVVICALISVIAADLSQYSKGEVERIWLPFMPWLTVPAALLNRHRFWLVLQAMNAIGLQVMLISKW